MESSNSIKIKIGIVILIHLAAIAFIGSVWQELSDEIPTHFNINGEADGFGKKNSIWILPLVSVFTSLLLFLSTRYPKYFNIPIKYKPEHQNQVFQAIKDLMRNMAIAVSMMFAYLTIGMAKVDLGDWVGLSRSFLYIFIGLILLLPIFTFLQINKYKADGQTENQS